MHNTRTRLQWKLLHNRGAHACPTSHGEYSAIRSTGTRNWSCRYNPVRITLYILIPCSSPATALRSSSPVHNLRSLGTPGILRSPWTFDAPQEWTRDARRVDEFLKAVEGGQLVLGSRRDAGGDVFYLCKEVCIVVVFALADVQRPGGVPARGPWSALNVLLRELDGDFLKDIFLHMVDEMGCGNWLG